MQRLLTIAANTSQLLPEPVYAVRVHSAGAGARWERGNESATPLLLGKFQPTNQVYWESVKFIAGNLPVVVEVAGTAVAALRLPETVVPLKQRGIVSHQPATAMPTAAPVGDVGIALTAAGLVALQNHYSGAGVAAGTAVTTWNRTAAGVWYVDGAAAAPYRPLDSGASDYRQIRTPGGRIYFQASAADLLNEIDLVLETP